MPKKIISDEYAWMVLNEECPSCGYKRTIEGHDNCIKNLNGIKFACCGHNGIFETNYQPYLVFYNNEYMGFETTEELKEYIKSFSFKFKALKNEIFFKHMKNLDCCGNKIKIKNRGIKICQDL